MQKIYPKFVLAFFAFSMTVGFAFGQTTFEFYNDGADVYVQAGGLIYVQGEVINDDEGANVGQIHNSGDIQLEGDWYNQSATSFVFQPGDPGTTTFLGNNAVQMIDGSRITRFNNLTLNKPGGTREVRQDIDAEADQSLNLNDDFLNTQANIFAVTNTTPAAITRAGGNVPNYLHSTVEGYVTSNVGSAGRLSRATLPGGTYFYPVGTSARWRPVEITPTTGGLNAYSVQFVDQATPNTGLRAPSLATINPAWYHFIERFAATGSPETIRIYHEFGPDDVCDIDNVVMAEWNGALWDDLSPNITSMNPAPNMSWTQKAMYPGAYPTPFNTNQFALAGLFLAPNISSCVFPVEILNLAATPLENSIMLNWETASETNNDGFEIHRSIDGENFSYVGWVDGSGTTNNTTPYAFEDHNVLPNQRYFYRLRQLDYSGSENFSNVVEAILLDGVEYALGGFYPNPSNGQTSLWVSVNEGSTLDITIYNALGQLVVDKHHELSAGYSTLDFDFSHLAKGAYFAKIRLNGELLNKQLIVE
ncbi:MAG: T9SS type A sorting domain-containing protein [Bacteroidota bacterium]